MRRLGSARDSAESLADRIARESYGRLMAYITCRTHDVAAAEDALSEAFTSALQTWPATGCPNNPEAWLLTVARRKYTDQIRRKDRQAKSTDELRLRVYDLDQVPIGEIPDRRLALMFACAHPAIESWVHAPLILQTVLGLDAASIAETFLTSTSAMSKRLVRAKEKIHLAGIAFVVPEKAEIGERLDAVLEAVYAAFTRRAHVATLANKGKDDLAEEALFLGRLLCDLLPSEPEVLGLLALMLFSQARKKAFRTQAGDYVPLDDQNRALWDWHVIDEAEAVLRRAHIVHKPGRYQLEAALQSAHIYRLRTGHNTWSDIVLLYDELCRLTGSTVAEINRAMAVAEVSGPSAGLAAMPAGDKHIAGYQPYWAARAELFVRQGSPEAARHAYEQAQALEPDPAVKRYLQKRAEEIRKT